MGTINTEELLEFCEIRKNMTISNYEKTYIVKSVNCSVIELENINDETDKRILTEKDISNNIYVRAGDFLCNKQI